MSSPVVFITGASSGIGRACALEFAQAGYHVAGMARRADRLAELEQAIHALPQPHGGFLPLVGDVTQAEAMQSCVQHTLARFGRVDVLIANAGIGQRGAVAESDWRDLETLLRTNIDGVLHSVRAVVPIMRQQNSGHIFTISSVVFNLVSPYAATYAASKAFVSSLAASMRVELEPHHITITDVLVGRTATEFNEKRLGEGKRTGEGIPTMSAEIVAQALIKATHKRPKTLILRPFDRLIVWGNRLVPSVLGELAKRQYR